MIFLKIIKLPFLVLRDIGKFFIIYMPGGFGVRLRYLYYKNKFRSCGTNVIIDVGVHIDGAELINIGDNVYIDKYCIIATGKQLTGKIKRKPNREFKGEEGEIIIGNDIHIAQFCILMGYGGISIGDNSVLSSGCKIYSLTNTAYDLENKEEVVSLMPYKLAPFLISSVVFGQNVWLGLNCIVMPSVVIDKNSFSVSNSVIVDSFQNNSSISGNPAKRIRDRFKIKEDIA
jgi:acetyltransferase-like isoleucine patch superfamily enzyme